MCGICGISAFRNNIIEEKEHYLHSMLDSIRHRGPDNKQTYKDESIVLGHVRLSIIDISNHANQPMINEDGSVIMVANAEIYNYKILRKQLIEKGHVFKSRTDVEVIIHAYEEYGDNFLHKIEGMFSIALYDKNKQTLLLARDRMGIKPLYYYEKEGEVIFSSEIKSFLQSGIIECDLDPLSVDQYVSHGYIPPPNTIIKNINHLNAGSMIKVSRNGIDKKKYWTMPEQGNSHVNEKDIIESTRDAIVKAINSHTMSDVPYGVFLSGGIDSTAIVAVMSKLLNLDVMTFSMSVPDESINESNLAERTAKKFNTNHHQFHLTSDDVISNIDDIINSIDQPSIDGINTYFISRFAKESGITVALSGLGADELFGGYELFNMYGRYSNLLKMWCSLPYSAKCIGVKFLAALKYRHSRETKLNRFCDTNDLVQAYAAIRFSSWYSDKHNMYNRNYYDYISEITDLHETPSQLVNICTKNTNAWRCAQELEINNYMQWRLLRDTDAMSMRHSLEVRVPFVSDNLVNHIMSLPSGWEKKLGFPKKLLTSSLSDLIPDFILNREKQGFQLPMGKWLRNDMQDMLKHIFYGNSSHIFEYFDPDYLRKQLDKFLSGKIPYEDIWKFVMLELWIEKNIKKAG